MITVFGRPLRGPSTLTRLVFFVGLSLALMMVDHRGAHLEKVRAALSVAMYPIQVVAGFPVGVYRRLAAVFATETTLRQENEALADEQRLLLGRLQQLESLEAENDRLRGMLGSATRVAARALAADILEVSLEPFTRRILLARGSGDGLYVGQAVIDAHGIVGQITAVGPHTSRATLITDPGHAIPVLINRNGLRAMVYGTGDQDSVKVPFLTSSSDIREGDLLVSSGMGGTFPPGYPVAQVTQVVLDPSEAFLIITAKPAARLNHGKQVLLIWAGTAEAKTKRPPATELQPATRAKGKRR